MIFYGGYDDVGKKNRSACAFCGRPVENRICFTRSGSGPKGCPTLTRKAVLEQANELYKPEKTMEFAYNISLQEAECYANRDQQPYIMQPSKTRIVEICEFALKMKYRRIGLAFCLGLAKEAEVADEIFKGYGLEVVSVCCKAGNTSKDFLGLSQDQKIYQDMDEAMCNPIFQAKVLEDDDVDFAVLLGLCVGHDTLFLQNCSIPATVLAVKDRVTGHNPLAAIYQADAYYKKNSASGWRVLNVKFCIKK